jgi:hypothetical protein
MIDQGAQIGTIYGRVAESTARPVTMRVMAAPANGDDPASQTLVRQSREPELPGDDCGMTQGVIHGVLENI